MLRVIFGNSTLVLPSKQSCHFLYIFFLVCFTSELYSQSVPSYVPTNGLVGWWGFNGNAQVGLGRSI
jgi:hypothetical protein